MSGTDGNSIGVIIPPPEVREVLEKTATFFVTKPTLEMRVIERYKNDERFAFVHETDPYHGYYLKRRAEIQQELQQSKHSDNKQQPSSLQQSQPQTQSQLQPKQSSQSQHLQHLQQQQSEKEEKDNDNDNNNDNYKDKDNDTNNDNDNEIQQQTETHTAQISYLKRRRSRHEVQRRKAQSSLETNNKSDDISVFTLPELTPRPSSTLVVDVMKLTAQFASSSSSSDFLKNLSRRESRNPLFDFLKPMHPYYITFQRLLSSYSNIRSNPKSHKQEMYNLISDKQRLLDQVWNLHDWDCQKAEREHEALLDEREKVRLAQIDWHDFVVVATVEFDEEEKGLSVPVNDAKMLPQMLAAARKERKEREKNRGDIDMDIDDDNVGVTMNTIDGNSGGAMPKDAQVELANVDSDIPIDRIRDNSNINSNNDRQYIKTTATHSQSQVPTSISSHATVPTISTNTTKTSTANATTTNLNEEATVVLPSGQKVPLSKAEISMRAELLDPSYKTERARAKEKSRVRNLAGGDEVARHLAKWDMAQSENGGVYNRGDLQEALSERKGTGTGIDTNAGGSGSSSGQQRKRQYANDGVVNNNMGPQLPEKTDKEEIEEQEMKRRKVERAVDVLAASSKGKMGNDSEMNGKNINGTADNNDDEIEDAEAESEDKRKSKGDKKGKGKMSGDDIEYLKSLGLQDGMEWMKKHGGERSKVKIRVAVAQNKNVQNKEWNLRGQEINMAAPLKSSVSKLKQALTTYTKVPANKQKLQLLRKKREDDGAEGGNGLHLKDNITLAAYNITDGDMISLQLKERGGKHKKK